MPYLKGLMSNYSSISKPEWLVQLYSYKALFL